jgi:hypothetical protein
MRYELGTDALRAREDAARPERRRPHTRAPGPTVGNAPLLAVPRCRSLDRDRGGEGRVNLRIRDANPAMTIVPGDAARRPQPAATICLKKASQLL